MANVIIKSEERKAYENRVLQSFGGDPNDKSSREAAECIAARSDEAYQTMKKQEERRK